MMRFSILGLLLVLGLGTARAVEPHPSIPRGPVPDGLGINIHFTQALPGEMEMLAATGVRWIRMDWGWGRTEKQKGVYSWAEPDKLVASMQKHKLRAVFVLSYGNKLYSPVSPATQESRAAFARWAVAAVSRYKGRGILWEMWNEPNLFWTPTPKADDYLQLALAAGAAIKKAAPGEALIGPAMARFDWEFFEVALKGGVLKYFDAVSVHPYRNTAPDTVAPDYARLREMIARYAPPGKSIPILSGEWGYSSSEGRLSEEQQARYLARQCLFNLAQGVPLSIWYDWRDDGDDPRQSEHRYGLVRRPHFANRTPAFDAKPAYLALQVLARELGGYRFARRLETGSPEDHVLLFERGFGGARKIAAWTAHGEGRAVSVPQDGIFAVRDLYGQQQPSQTSREGRLALQLSPSAIYATFEAAFALPAAVEPAAPLAPAQGYREAVPRPAALEPTRTGSSR